MGIDDFESLHGGKHPHQDPIHPHDQPKPERELNDDLASDALLLEKLNRDIASWRSTHEHEQELDSETLENEENLQAEESAIEEIVKDNFKQAQETEKVQPSAEPMPKPQPGKSSWTPLGSVLAKVYPKLHPEVALNPSGVASKPLGDVNYDPITEPRNPILPATNLGEEEIGSEEPLEDEPIFFEEPVE